MSILEKFIFASLAQLFYFLEDPFSTCLIFHLKVNKTYSTPIYFCVFIRFLDYIDKKNKFPDEWGEVVLGAFYNLGALYTFFSL